MAIQTAVNFVQGLGAQLMKWADADSDAYERLTQLFAVAKNLDEHDHKNGFGLPIKRIQSGTASARPAAGNAGHIYFATDTGQLSLDNGSVWMGLTSTIPGGFIGARVYHNATQSIANNTATAVAFNNESWDTDTLHDKATNNSRLTCKTAGKYLVLGVIAFAGNATGVRDLYLYHGTSLVNVDRKSNLDTNDVYLHVADVVDMAVNDYVELKAYQTSGAALNVLSNVAYSPGFVAVRV